MILDIIADSTRVRVEEEKKKQSLKRLRELALAGEVEEGVRRLPEFSFEKAIGRGDIQFICEVKKASPSKGVIAADFPYTEIAGDYEKAGAACISVLTEPEFFKGRTEYLAKIKKMVDIPVLRKDFIIDEYQIYQAKILGADCILLICTLLTQEELSRYQELADSLGMSVLTEAHDEEEIKMALRAGSRMIGVNNRDLKTFEVDIHNSERLRSLVPPQILFVAESGIRTSQDIDVLRKAGVNGVLIGETLMKSPDKKRALEELRGKA